MTGVTGLVDRRLPQEKIVISIVRIVTVAARHVSKPQWVTARLERVRTPSRVAFKTGFLLRQRIKYAVSFAVYLMAGCAGDISRFVPASKPAETAMVFMAIQTHLVLCLYRRL